MTKLWVLPLEPLDMRYTIQWRKWFEELLKKKQINYYMVDGETLTKDIEHGEVLDAHGTNSSTLHT